MIINSYNADLLESVFGVDMATIEGVGVGAGWIRVPPGGGTEIQQHDETETLVIVQGAGTFIVDGKPHPATAGTVVVFEPFESHEIKNLGASDLVFVTLYWRQPERAVWSALRRDQKRFGQRPIFVFSTPPTPNGDLHLGHLCGPYLGADVFVRFQRMNGVQAWHLTGSDDFQSYVVGRARAEGRSPAETAAHYSAEIAATLKLMDIEPDQYTVTNDDPGYPDGLRRFFSRVAGSGRVTAAAGPALFDAETGEYLYEGDVHGNCPGCNEITSGNICEECGEPNICTDLGEPRPARSGGAVRTGSATRFTLPLHEFKAEVMAHHGYGRVPARLKDLAQRLFQRGELDIPISHPSSWGVRPAEPGADGQVIWVWPEMAYGFLHDIEALGRSLGKDWQADTPEQEWKIVHFFGYDNSFYHAILFPVLYRLAFPGWTPDIDYHVNEFYLLDGQKFSTSRRHAIWGKQILGPHSVDAVRFFLCRTRPEGRRTNFSREAYEQILAETLAGRWQDWLTGLGERAQARYGDVVPDAGIWTPEQTAFLARLATRLAAVTGSLGENGFSLNRAAAELDGIVEDARAFSAQEAGLAAGSAEARTAIALELAAAKLLAECAAPVMPRFAASLAQALGLPAQPRWPDTVTLITPGTRIDLSQRTFFTPAASPSPLLSWLDEKVRAALALPEDEPVAGQTLAALGMTSMQALGLQYQILEKTGVEVQLDELLGQRDLTELAALVNDRSAETVTV